MITAGGPRPRLALVTGAAGFIGSNLVRRLVRSGEDVVAVDAFTGHDVERKVLAAGSLGAEAGVEVVELDLAEGLADGMLDGVDVVYHLAGQPGVRSSWGDGFDRCTRDNLTATQRLFEAIAGSSVRRVVSASSSSVYGNALDHPTTESANPRPVSPYAVTKLGGEHIGAVYASAGGPSVVALRYFTVYGPNQRPDMAVHRLFESALHGDPFTVFGGGGQVRDLTFVDDVIEATIAAGSVELEGFTVVNVAGGGAVSLRDLIAAVGEASGLEVPTRPGRVAAGDVERTSASIDRARQLLGWSPQVSLEEGLRRQLAWHRDRAAP